MNSLIINNGSQIFNKANTTIYFEDSKKTLIHLGSGGLTPFRYFQKNSKIGSERNEIMFDKKFGIEEFFGIKKNEKFLYLNQISSENICAFVNGKIASDYNRDGLYSSMIHKISDKLFTIVLYLNSRPETPEVSDLLIVNSPVISRFETFSPPISTSIDIGNFIEINGVSNLFIDGLIIPKVSNSGKENWKIQENILSIANASVLNKHIVLVSGLSSVEYPEAISDGEIVIPDGVSHKNLILFVDGKILNIKDHEIDYTSGIGKVNINSSKIKYIVCKRPVDQMFDMYPSIISRGDTLIFDNDKAGFFDDVIIQNSNKFPESISSSTVLDIANSTIKLGSKLKESLYGDDYTYINSVWNPSGSIVFDEKGNNLKNKENSKKSITIESDGNYIVTGSGAPKILKKNDSFFIKNWEHDVTLYKNAQRVSKTFDLDDLEIAIGSKQIISLVLNGKQFKNYILNDGIVSFEETDVKARGNIAVILCGDIIVEEDDIVLSHSGYEYFNIENMNSAFKIDNVISVSETPTIENLDVSMIKAINIKEQISMNVSGVITLQLYFSDSKDIEKFDRKFGKIIIINTDGMYNVFCNCKSTLGSSSMELETNGYSYNIEYSHSTGWVSKK